MKIYDVEAEHRERSRNRKTYKPLKPLQAIVLEFEPIDHYFAIRDPMSLGLMLTRLL